MLHPGKYRKFNEMPEGSRFAPKHKYRIMYIMGNLATRLLKHVSVNFFSRNDTWTVLTRFHHLRRRLNRFGLDIFNCLVGLEPAQVAGTLDRRGPACSEH